ncbi:MAG: Ig-like domain-containing protein [Ginsengibacter sp.]
MDDALTTLGENGLDLGSGGRIVKSSAGPGVIEIDFPNGASLIVTPAFWDYYKQWYLNLDISNTMARKGLMGVIPDSSWLPALPDGTSLGPKPDTPHLRFVTLYRKFADAWRVTDTTSLFHYASGDSTGTFTDTTWPAENARSCSVPKHTPLPPIGLLVAEQLCSGILDPNLRADAIFDVMTTGDSSFAKSYLLIQRVKTGTTTTVVNTSKDTTKYGEPVAITATVFRKFPVQKDILTGSVEFTADGEKLGQVKLEANGRAVLTTTSLKAGPHKIAAMFTPDAGSKAFSSSSLGVTHMVIGGTSILHQWWFWLLILLIIVAIIIALLRKKKNP